jgi:hypothetical protein
MNLNKQKYNTKSASNLLIFLGIFCLCSVLTFISPVTSLAYKQDLKFDPNFVISNQTFNNMTDFPTAASVQTVLENKGSFLASYKIDGKMASQIIFDASTGVTSEKYGVKPKINPALMLTMLEKEQSLLGIKTYDTIKDPEKRLRSAMGYGCPDSSVCDPDYAGFKNQVEWGAFQLQANYNFSTNKSKVKYAPYFVGETIKTGDGYSVVLQNEATASLYRYTPHVYWGNYNVFKIMVANGWTIDKTKYSYEEIDNANKAVSTNCTNTVKKKYSIGTTSSDIITLQTCLKEAGYFDYPTTTGFFGNITRSGIIRYLKDKLGACEYLYYQEYAIGSTGSEIVKAQQCLRDAGLFKFSTNTGYYGNITKAAHQNYRGW